MAIEIREMQEGDISDVARVHAAAFSRQTNSEQWVAANFRAFPRILYFVAVEEGRVLGYIEWIEKAGLREEAVMELEQIAVVPSRQGQGIGKRLIRESLDALRRHLSDRGSRLKSVLVTTRTDNEAQRLYADLLGAERVAVIEGLYSADEAILLARGPFPEGSPP